MCAQVGDIASDPGSSTIKLPVTVLSGMLGAGKSTLLKHILTNQEGMKIAVIVNDMSELNIDSEELKKAGIIRKIEAEMVEMQNGCICCTLRDDLLKEVSRLAASKQFDYLVIESTGISEPIPVAQTFTFTAPGFAGLPAIARLDTMVTVVDAASIWSDFQSGESLLDRKQQAGPGDEREISDLILDQLELADVVLVNKCDVVKESEARQVETFIRKINPKARVHRTVRSNLPLKEVLDTGLFNMEEAQKHQGWIEELQNPHHTPETEEYGISSFVFRTQRPFHSERLLRLLAHWVNKIATPVPGEEEEGLEGAGGEQAAGAGADAGSGSGSGSAAMEDGDEDEDEDEKGEVKQVEAKEEDEEEGEDEDGIDMRDRPEAPPGGLAESMGCVLRSKGFVWMDTLKDFNVFWSQSGKLLQVRVGGPWWACLPDEKWPKDEDRRKELKEGWDRRWGDRRTELVMIGKDMDKAKVAEALEWCLCTEEEMKGGFRALTSHEDTLLAGVNREALAMQIAMWPADGDEGEEEEEEEEEAGGGGASAPMESGDDA